MYYPPQQHGPRYSGCLKFLLYGVSLVIPLAGIIIGIIFMSKGDPESNSLGKTCLIISIVVFVLSCCVGIAMSALGVLPAFLEGLQVS